MHCTRTACQMTQISSRNCADIHSPACTSIRPFKESALAFLHVPPLLIIPDAEVLMQVSSYPLTHIPFTAECYIEGDLAGPYAGPGLAVQHHLVF
jgi:hypothetical protein